MLFDAGNTLIYPDYAFVQKLLAERSAEVRIETLKQLEFEAKVAAQSSQVQKPWKEYFSHWLTSAGMSNETIPELLSILWNRHREKNLWSVLDEDAIKTLAELKRRHFLSGVISNSDGRVEKQLSNLGLSKYLDIILDSEIIGISKPDAGIFKIALNELDVKPDSTIFIGDSYKHDVVAAQQVGMHAILFDPLKKLEHHDCLRINRLTQVFDFI